MTLMGVKLWDLDRRRLKDEMSHIVVTVNGSKGCSPEQIANRLQIDFSEDKSMRISHEATYKALYIQGRALKPIYHAYHLPREEDYGLTPKTKNGPALAGYGAVTMTIMH